MRVPIALLLAALIVDGTALAANLVQNAGFDDDIDGWSAMAAPTIQHAAADELGSPVSGSIELRSTALSQSSISASQCIPVVAGKTYAFGASARIAVGQPVNAAFVDVDWSSQPNCTGAIDPGKLGTPLLHAPARRLGYHAEMGGRSARSAERPAQASRQQGRPSASSVPDLVRQRLLSGGPNLRAVADHAVSQRRTASA